MARRWILLSTLFFPLLASAEPPAAGQYKSGTFDPPRAAPQFRLVGPDGAELTLSRYRGKVVALVFGFTNCTRICPLTLTTLSQVSRKLGPRASELQVVFVTVDPERDSPARLREFLGYFDPSYVGATGTPEQLEALRREYGISTKREAAAQGYDVHHSSFFYLIDRQGQLRLLVPFGKSTDDVVHDVQLLLGS